MERELIENIPETRTLCSIERPLHTEPCDRILLVPASCWRHIAPR